MIKIKMIKIKNFTRVLDFVKKNQVSVLELRYTRYLKLTH